jgi:hypothetical protein
MALHGGSFERISRTISADMVVERLATLQST